jgi:glycosyltransferase involved in cell wall biosynthesis
VARHVLYVNHTASVSGGERSLLDLLRGLPDDIAATVASPPGELAGEVAALGVSTARLRGTDAGLGVHPTRTPRAVAALTGDGLTLLRHARRHGVALIHANSVRAALACAVARRLGGPPLAVHVHDILGTDRISSAVRAVVNSTADVVLANSECVRATVERPGGPAVVVVDNPVDVACFDPGRADGARMRRELGLDDQQPALVIVGQITPWKGQETAIRALAQLPERFSTTRLLIVGAPVFAAAGTSYDNLAYLNRLRELVSELGVGDRVIFLGARSDVPDVLAAATLALVPSWVEPFGRVVIEAMAMGVPVVATERGGPAEILAGEAGGVLVPPRDAAAWSHAIERLLDDRDERTRLGATGRRRALARYTLDRFVSRVLAAYAVGVGGEAFVGTRSRAALQLGS